MIDFAFVFYCDFVIDLSLKCIIYNTFRYGWCLFYDLYDTHIKDQVRLSIP